MLSASSIVFLFISLQHTYILYSPATSHPGDFKKFQRGFLLVYLMAKAADWMQGPYVYALYDSYGFSHEAIGQLFIAGYGSSLVFGTFVGSIADRFGRKRNCLLYGLLYGLSCLTKHVNNFNVLLAGRILGGVATSILYSAFETWMISEHKSTAYPDDWLSHTFTTMTLWDGILAIAGGLLASILVDGAHLGMVAPFDAALVMLVATTAVISMTWKENYGDRTVTVSHNLGKAMNLLFSNSKVALIGIIVSCFESSMYVFVFMWTPKLKSTLRSSEEALPHGVIFASFMVSCMIGSQVYRALTKIWTDENILRVAFAVGVVTMIVAAVSESTTVVLVAFFSFEVTVGLYWPSIGTIRARYLPQEVRATLMNVFRVGLNIIVVTVLYNIEALSHRKIFSSCAILLAMGAMCVHLLYQVTQGNKSSMAAALSELGGQDADANEGGGDVENPKKDDGGGAAAAKAVKAKVEAAPPTAAAGGAADTQ